MCSRWQLVDELIFHLRYVNVSPRSHKGNMSKGLVWGTPQISAGCGSLLLKLNINRDVKCHYQEGWQTHVENLLTCMRNSKINIPPVCAIKLQFTNTKSLIHLLQRQHSYLGYDRPLPFPLCLYLSYQLQYQTRWSYCRFVSVSDLSCGSLLQSTCAIRSDELKSLTGLSLNSYWDK